MDAGHKAAARLPRKVKHDVAEEDNVKAVARTAKRQLRCADIGLTEVAELLDFGLGEPVLADAIEEAHQTPGWKSSVHLNAVIATLSSTLYNLCSDIGTLNPEVPAGKCREALAEQHGDAVGFLTCRACGAPKSKSALGATSFDEFWKDLSAQQFERAAVTEEAGFVYGHCLGNSALEGRVLAVLELMHKFFKMRYALPPKEAIEPCLKEIIVRRLKYVLGLVENQLAKVGIVDSGGNGHS
jgi:hypothetical protein